MIFFLKVTTLRADVAKKDMYISELLDRLAIVECEVKAGAIKAYKQMLSEVYFILPAL